MYLEKHKLFGLNARLVLITFSVVLFSTLFAAYITYDSFSSVKISYLKENLNKNLVEVNRLQGKIVYLERLNDAMSAGHPNSKSAGIIVTPRLFSSDIDNENIANKLDSLEQKITNLETQIRYLTLEIKKMKQQN